MSSMDPFTPPEVTAIMLETGLRKARQPYLLTFWKAVFGGWMVGFGANLVHCMHGGAGTLGTSAPAIINLLGALFFPIPLLMILVTGQELLTMNLMVLPMAMIKRNIRVWECPLNWLIVFWGNFGGILFYVALMGHYSDLYDDANLAAFAIKLAEKKCRLDWGACFLRGIGCNFLVCMGVWLAVASREMGSKIIAMYLPASLFVFLGFEHIVANMYFIPMGIWCGADVSIRDYIARSLIPSFIGNIIGGCLLGIPQLIVHSPPELPSWLQRNKLARSRSSSATFSVNATGSTTPTSHIEQVPRSKV